MSLAAVRRPTSLGPPAARSLPPRQHTHLRDGILWASVGVGGRGVIDLVGYPRLAVLSMIVGIGLALFTVVGGELERRRHQLQDRVVEAISPLMGIRALDRSTVVLARWSWGWPGTPRIVRIRYAPGAQDRDPAWLSTLQETLRARLLCDYRVKAADPRRCRLTFVATAPTETDRSPTRVRVERTIGELIGPTAKVGSVDVDDETDAPQRIEVSHEAGTKLAAGGYRARVERTLSAVFPGRWRARWNLEEDTVTFELRPSFPETSWLPPSRVDQTKDVLATYDRVELPFGVDEDGNVQVWRPAIDPNLMVVGAPGTGKTTFEHTILAGASVYGWPIWVVDGKAVEFLGFRLWPNVQIVATTVEEQVAVIERAWEVMEHRYQLIVRGRASETDFEPLMLFLDEFADFRSNLMDWYATIKVKGDPTRPPVLAKAASIARKGRTSRVHLLFATQRPDAEYFGGDMRDNFRARISMGRLSPQGAMMMWQDPVTGTTIPRGCRGRATTINDQNRPIEIQSYRVPDPRKAERHQVRTDLDRLDRLRPATSRHERLLIVPPAAEADLDTSEPVTHRYHDYAQAAWVRADTRPDLDPVAGYQGDDGDPRELASPLTVFGIDRLPGETGLVPSGPGGRRPRLTLVPPPDLDEDDRPGSEEGTGADPFDGYGPPVDVPAGQVAIGDYVLVDADTGHWAVVDDEPDVDLMDPDCTAVPWRDDSDEQGLLGVPQGERVTVRHPLQED